VHLSRILIHPVKSLASMEVERCLATPRGPAGDRLWMLADARGGFVTQRSEPRLALIATRLEGDSVILSAPGRGEIRLCPPGPDAPSTEVVIWGDRVAAPAGSAAAAKWLSSFLGREVRPVWMPDDVRRPVDPAYAAAGDHVSFADGFPYLLIGEASLADLNARLAVPVGMRRFRPNLVIAGSAPFAEDGWRRIRIGEVAFRCVKPCARCTVTTVDPDTGTTGPEPLRTLATYRLRDGKAMFGMNLIADGEGELRVGDRLAIL
jgi:uncharacterized protein YcbX